DVRGRLREGPVVAAGVDGGVLPLAVRIVRRRADDPRAVRGGAVVMGVGVFDANEQTRLRALRRVLPLDRDHGAVAVDELNTMVADSKSLARSEERRVG